MPKPSAELPALLLGMLLLAGPLAGFAQQNCGSLENAFGPYNYNDPLIRQSGYGGSKGTIIDLVEGAHLRTFESLSRPDFETMGSIDYTLRAIPNNPRALFLLIRLHRKLNGNMPKPPRVVGDSSAWPGTPECYFERAMRFVPRDPIVRQLLGVYLHWNGKYQQALDAYGQATDLGLKSAELYYNIGLAHFELKQYAEAKDNAHKAYDMGYPSPGLRNKLGSVGQWP